MNNRQEHPAETRQKALRSNPSCIACGRNNLAGLKIDFMRQGDAVTARWTPTEHWVSFEGTIHGGIISTVLDEAMSKAVIARDWEALTADLRVRFRGRVHPGDELFIRGWITARQKRRIRTEARLATKEGDERAHGWATFLVPPAR